MINQIKCVSLREHKRNEEIREAATVQPIATHLMQKRLRRYGHVRRSYERYNTRTVLDMVVTLSQRFSNVHTDGVLGWQGITAVKL